MSVLNPAQVAKSSLRAIIELGEINDLSDGIYLHGVEAVSDQVFNAFEKSSQNTKVSRPTGNFGLPPGSLSTIMGEDLIDHAFVGDFDSQYKDKYSGTMFRNRLNLPDDYCESKDNAAQGSQITDMAITLAKTALSLALGEDQALDIKVDNETIQELVCCYLISPQQCDKVSNLFNVTYVSSHATIPPEQRLKELSKLTYLDKILVYSEVLVLL